MIVDNITKTIGKTPMVDISRNFKDIHAQLLVKVESFNPGGSVKDRIAFSMIQVAMAEGLILPDTHIIEPTSGNTGIGLAMVCAALGLKCTIIMPESATLERRQIIKAYGAALVLSPADKGMKGAIAIAQEMALKEKNSFIPMQFENMANPMIHMKTTGPEILADVEGKVDVFVGGVGTGGTISGVGTFLKKFNPDIKIIAVEPSKSPMISKGTAGPHHIYGIGAGFIPDTLNQEVIDQVITVEDEDAVNHMLILAQKTGIFAGISSGAAFSVALALAKDVSNKGKTIVTLLPDGGERYFSSSVFRTEIL